MASFIKKTDSQSNTLLIGYIDRETKEPMFIKAWTTVSKCVDSLNYEVNVYRNIQNLILAKIPDAPILSYHSTGQLTKENFINFVKSKCNNDIRPSIEPEVNSYFNSEIKNASILAPIVRSAVNIQYLSTFQVTNCRSFENFLQNPDERSVINIIYYLYSIITAIKLLNMHGIFHNDLHAKNILIGDTRFKRNRILIFDFDLAYDVSLGPNNAVESEHSNERSMGNISTLWPRDYYKIMCYVNWNLNEVARYQLYNILNPVRSIRNPMTNDCFFKPRKLLDPVKVQPFIEYFGEDLDDILENIEINLEYNHMMSPELTELKRKTEEHTNDLLPELGTVGTTGTLEDDAKLLLSLDSSNAGIERLISTDVGPAIPNIVLERAGTGVALGEEINRFLDDIEHAFEIKNYLVESPAREDRKRDPRDRDPRDSDPRDRSPRKRGDVTDRRSSEFKFRGADGDLSYRNDFATIQEPYRKPYRKLNNNDYSKIYNPNPVEESVMDMGDIFVEADRQSSKTGLDKPINFEDYYCPVEYVYIYEEKNLTVYV